MAFSFGFSGDDIDTGGNDHSAIPAGTTQSSATTSAFPVPGKPQLQPKHHPLSSLLSHLPSKIAFSCLDVRLDDGTTMRLPRRELWDVRVQLMAEDDGQGGTEGLGDHDVKTGVYEGGFKSWESSVDLVRVLAAAKDDHHRGPLPVRVVELGCGTALPSLALFRWACDSGPDSRPPFSFVIADYNPSVLQLVTLPNFILTWALSSQSSMVAALRNALSDEGELELSPEVLEAFQAFLSQSQIGLSFLSGAWSKEFVDLIYATAPPPGDATPTATTILGAETIYSPFALQAFTETVFSILERERTPGASAFVAAKRLYFGVGGSLDDFVSVAQERGANVVQLSEETEYVRRGVVRCSLERVDSAG